MKGLALSMAATSLACAGTSEGAKKGWEARGRGGGGSESPKKDPMVKERTKLDKDIHKHENVYDRHDDNWNRKVEMWQDAREAYRETKEPKYKRQMEKLDAGIKKAKAGMKAALKILLPATRRARTLDRRINKKYGSRAPRVSRREPGSMGLSLAATSLACSGTSEGAKKGWEARGRGGGGGGAVSQGVAAMSKGLRERVRATKIKDMRGAAAREMRAVRAQEMDPVYRKDLGLPPQTWNQNQINRFVRQEGLHAAQVRLQMKKPKKYKSPPVQYD